MKKASRTPSRLLIALYAARNAVRRRRARPTDPRRILIAHHLLLGDTLMLTPLIAKLRAAFPAAAIEMTTPTAFVPLYRQRPYGVEALPYDPRDPATLRALRRRGGYDLAFVPGDNRYAWLALALGARWIVAHAGDRPAYKNWPLDERVPCAATPTAWGDMVAELAPGAEPPPFAPEQWRAPEFAPFVLPPAPYCVLHVGASSPLKQWEAAKWRALAEELTRRGLHVVWSAGRDEEHIVAAIDPERHFTSVAGRLDLAQLWHLLAHADLLVCPDTGVAHLGRIVGVPTVTLFGPGSAVICGAGRFWRASPYAAVTVADFPCRDQTSLFKRILPWARRCARKPTECAAPRCMQALSVAQVGAAIESLLAAAGRRRQA